jgi:hypothetical protein
MRKRFIDIVTDVAEDTGIGTTPTILGYIKRWVNRRYAEFLRRINHDFVNHDFTISTVGGVQDYILPDDFSKEIYVVDKTANKNLDRVSLEQLARNWTSSLESSAEPERYVIIDDVVREHPPTEAKIGFASSNAADVGQKIYIRGISDNVEISETVNLNGTNSTDTQNTYSRVKAVSKDNDTLGKVTGTSGTTTVCVLYPEQRESRVKLIRFHMIPGSVKTMEMPYIIKPLPMIDDGDYPLLDIDDALEAGAKADAYRKLRRRSDSRDMEILFEKGIQDYLWAEEFQPNKIPLFQPTPYSRETT